MTYHVQFSLLLLGDRCYSQEMEASPTPNKHGFCLDTACRASKHQSSPWLEPSIESLLESPITELSLDSNLSTIFSISIPWDQGKYEVHQAEPPCFVRLSTSGRSPGVPEGTVNDRLTHCHSSHRHGFHTVGSGIVFQGLLSLIRCVLHNRVTSHRMWLFTMHRWSWVERG